jgi:hypothetical protein
MVIHISHLFDYYAHRQYEFMLGWQLVGQVSALITFETFAMVFCSKFGIVGLPALVIYAGVPVISVVGIIYLGHEMIRTGYAHKYQQYGMNVNKDWENTVKHIAWIREQMESELKKVEEEIKDEQHRNTCNGSITEKD